MPRAPPGSHYQHLKNQEFKKAEYALHKSRNFKPHFTRPYPPRSSLNNNNLDSNTLIIHIPIKKYDIQTFHKIRECDVDIADPRVLLLH